MHYIEDFCIFLEKLYHQKERHVDSVLRLNVFFRLRIYGSQTGRLQYLRRVGWCLGGNPW